MKIVSFFNWLHFAVEDEIYGQVVGFEREHQNLVKQYQKDDGENK